MQLIRDKVNQTYGIREAYYLATGHQAPSGKCFCPFHHNVNTPAAKVYQKVMVCFGECHRSYDAYDFLKQFCPDLVAKVAGVAPIQTTQVSQPKKEDYPDFHANSTQELIDKWNEINANAQECSE